MSEESNSHPPETKFTRRGEETVGSDYVPRFVLDLTKANARNFAQLREDFEQWARSLGELPSLELKNGWHAVTQQIAEQWLLRNVQGANRPSSLPTIVYYFAQQADGRWPKTGQPIIFDVNGVLKDGQHRLWACYLGNTTFETYVVADAPDIPKAFAYYDNVKARTPATALATAGLNGLSPLINQTLQILMSFEARAYTATHKKQMPRMAPIEVVDFVLAHPELRRAVKLAAGEYQRVCDFIGYKDVVAFVIYKVAALYDENTVDEFLGEIDEQLGEVAVLPEGSPIAALHKVIDADNKSREPMTKHQVLAHVIKAFNAWKLGQPVKKLTFRVNEDFPAFVTNQEEQPQEAALELV